VLMTYSNAVC